MGRLLGHLTYSRVVSTLALVLAITGTGIAAVALDKNSVGSKQIKTGAVRSAEAKGLRVKDLAFPLALGGVLRTNALNPAADTPTTVFSVTGGGSGAGSPRDPASMVVIGAFEVTDNNTANYPGPTLVTVRMLENGQPEGGTFSSRVEAGATETIPVVIPCDLTPGEPYTMDLQVSLSQPSTIGDRAYEGYTGPASAEPPAAP